MSGDAERTAAIDASRLGFRPIAKRSFNQIEDEGVERFLENDGKVTAANAVAEEILRLANLIPNVARSGELKLL